MEWISPSFEEVKMNCEINSYAGGDYPGEDLR
jgi:hypothetical protein